MGKYKPHKLQREFHKSKAKVRAAVAGRFGGKSVMGINECFAASLNGLDGTLPVPNHGIIISPSDQMLMDDLSPVIDEYLPVQYIPKKGRMKRKILFTNGSTITLRSGFRPDALRGVHPHWVYFDEAAYFPNGKAFTSMLVALQPGGMIWLTSTPKGYNWFYKLIVAHAIAGKQVGHGWVSDDGKFFAIKWSTFDNPYHAKDLVDVLERSLPDEKYKMQELYADFVSYEGSIYDFREEDIKGEMPTSYTDVVVGVDVGYSHPTVFELAVKSGDVWYVVEEVVVRNKTASQLADIGVHLTEKWHHDAKFFMSHERPETRQEFVNKGLRAFMANHDVEYGIGLVKDALSYGRLKIVNAPVFLDEMKSYHYENGRIYKVDDDACDAMRYLVAGIQKPMHAKIILPKLNRWRPVRDERRMW